MSSQAQSMPNDPNVATIIGGVESGWRSHALRFEPTVYARISTQSTTPVLLRIAAIHECSLPTARVIYSSSWGEFQIMGFNLYSEPLNVAVPVWDYMAGDQKETFYRFLTENRINWTWSDMKADRVKLDTFALHYNGSTVYAERMTQIAASKGL